jgi:predicted DNA-binding transcriptional regulator YafY
MFPMPQISHPYQDRKSLERLLLLIATFIHYPGVGCADPLNAKTQEHHQALAEVRDRLQSLAQSLNIELPHCAISTLRKDLETLRQYSILDRRMYRWGYYLGTGAMDLEQLQAALQALGANAEHQGDPKIRQIFDTLQKRLRGLNLEQQQSLFYPVRTSLNRVIVYSDPAEMMQKGVYRHTLFHQLDALEHAIVEGQAIELFCKSNPYDPSQVGHIQVFPLQLIYADIAWYLLIEHCHNQHLEIVRIDRFQDTLKSLNHPVRGIDAQIQQMNSAHDLLQAGWGLFLGNPQAQKDERAGLLELIQVKARFFSEVIPFIAEGEKRHPRQTILKGPKGSNGLPQYVDYDVLLPQRSLNEFSRWLNRFMDQALVLSPPELVQKHADAAQRLCDRYLQLY